MNACYYVSPLFSEIEVTELVNVSINLGDESLRYVSIIQNI